MNGTASWLVLNMVGERRNLHHVCFSKGFALHRRNVGGQTIWIIHEIAYQIPNFVPCLLPLSISWLCLEPLMVHECSIQ